MNSTAHAEWVESNGLDPDDYEQDPELVEKLQDYQYPDWLVFLTM